jgi:hypothetical protein
MRRTCRLVLTLALILGSAGCAWSGEAVPAPAPADAVDGGRPTEDPGLTGSAGPEPRTDDVASTQADPAVPLDPVVGARSVPSADQADESMVWIPAGDHEVPGTLAMPTRPTDRPAPVVLMLHGDLSSRDENGGLFARQAAALADDGIASLRIDFAGSGDSPELDLALDYPDMVGDAAASLDYLQSDDRVDSTRMAVLGLSRGGAIAATLAGTRPGVAALLEWSGAVYNGYDEDPDLHDQARVDGYVDLGPDPGGFKLSLSWFDTIEQSHPLTDVSGYTGPVLAITGSDDEVVPPTTSDVLVHDVASTDTTRDIIDGADHEYQATSDDQTHADEVIRLTAQWLTSRLAGART